jgi:hypothetical protein
MVLVGGMGKKTNLKDLIVKDEIMKEIPILYSTPMVQAILAGRKTMTRRIMNPQPGYCNHSDYTEAPWKNEPPMFIESAADPYYWYCRYCGNGIIAKNDYKGIKCPYGRPGDLFWVRESFRINRWMHEDGELTFRYEADGGISKVAGFDDDETFNRYWQQSCDDLYKAGYQPNDEERFQDYDYKALRLRPNIFMPKEISRIWLQVTDVRIERLQDISHEDAQAEGVEKIDESIFNWRHYGSNYAGCSDARTSFQSLWQSINGDESWDANPFVWVISFEVLSSTGKPSLQTEKTIG